MKNRRPSTKWHASSGPWGWMILFALFCPRFPAGARDYRLTLAASPADRAGVVVSFPLPPDAPQHAILRDAAGQGIPMQRDEAGKATFVLAALPAGKPLDFTLSAAPALTEHPEKTENRVHSGFREKDLQVSIAGQPVLRFRMDREAVPRPGLAPEILRAGYIHPVFSPAGYPVTDDYPSNHVHHHGIWAPWVKTRFQGRSPDFWNMQLKTGAEEFVELQRQWSGPVHGGFQALNRMTDRSAPQPVSVLNSLWNLTAYAVPEAPTPMHLFDLVITQTCATADALDLPEYHYGGFGLRGASAWNGPGGAARFLTSEGLTDRLRGNGTRARWCYLGGPVGGTAAGTAVLGHPDNFRSPQPLRLHPDMPYFSFVPQQLGAFTIQPGRPYTVRFRFVVTDGEPSRPLLEACWEAYARPPEVTLTPLETSKGQ